MTGWWIALAGVLLAGFALISLVLTMLVLAVKAVFWLVLLPFRLLFWAVGAVAMVIGGVLALGVGLLLLLAPLLPLVFLGGIVYLVVKAVRRPVTA